MRLVLIGFMGAGKSSVASALSDAMAVSHYEMDAMILSRSGKASIAAIFAEEGESAFRKLEADVACELGCLDAGIISTGGGVIGRNENMEALGGKGSWVVFLRASFTALEARLAGDTTRPLFADVDAARQLFEQRQPVYQQYADLIIDTDEKEIDAVRDAILLAVEER